MRIFISVLVLIFSFQSWTKADDIRGFNIEGFYIGDSLLDHLKILNKTETQVKNKKLKYYPNSKRLAISNFYDGNFEVYESVQFTLDPKTFKIYRISGKIYDLTKNNCVILQNEIIATLEEQFPKAVKEVEDFAIHDIDKTGESVSNGIYLDFESGDALSVECYLWGDKFKKERNYPDHISVSIETKESRDFIENEAYD